MASISRTARFAARTIRPSLRPTFLPARPASFRHVSASTPIQSQTLLSRRYASSGTDSSTAEDPTLARSIELLEQGTSALEQGDLEGAKKFYKQSVDVKSSSGGWFNLGVSDTPRAELERIERGCVARARGKARAGLISGVRVPLE